MPGGVNIFTTCNVCHSFDVSFQARALSGMLHTSRLIAKSTGKAGKVTSEEPEKQKQSTDKAREKHEQSTRKARAKHKQSNSKALAKITQSTPKALAKH